MLKSCGLKKRLARELSFFQVFRLNFATDLLNLPLDSFYQAGIVVVKHLIQAPNSEAGLRVKPSTLRSRLSEKDDANLYTSLPINSKLPP